MQQASQAFDILVRNGTIVDGSGGPRLRADLGITGDRIARLGDLRGAGAARIVDASGLIVAPGFIDVHTHDDAALIARPQMLPKLTQGVTTVVAGNCGISAAPYSSGGDPPDLLRLVFKSGRFVAPTLEQYLQAVTAAGPAVNSAFLTGHTTLRMQVMGTDLARPATSIEIGQMRELLAQCLEQGAIGLSTGLFYPPARAASTQEVIDIAEPLARYGGIYTTHMRDEGDHVMESLRETVQIGRALDVPAVVSHHKCMGKSNFGRSVETLRFLREAGHQQRIMFDVYPYTACSTVLNLEMVRESLRTMITWCDPYPQFAACDLHDAARMLGCSLEQAVAQLQPAGAVYFMMDEADVTRILSSAQAMIGSDGLPEDQHPHPRLWGTFARVLGCYVRERQVLSLEDAIHRMTGLSARCFGIQRRGRLAIGNYADVCIFDPDTVVDAATFERPATPAVGIHYVLVNGQVSLDHGTPTGMRAGRVLRRTEPSPSMAAGGGYS